MDNEKTTVALAIKNNRKKILWAIVLILLIAVSYGGGYSRGKRVGLSSTQPIPLSQVQFQNTTKGADVTIDFSLFWKVWDLLKSDYVDSAKLDSRTLFYGAIKGMMAATGDPYTTFFDPQENTDFNQQISGNFEGIGAELGVKNDILTVIAPLDGTPAAKAGLKAGDEIIKINGKDASSMTVDEAVGSIRGPKGTSVVLTIYRSGDQNTQDITVQRDIITVKSVNLSWKDNNIADIKISEFGDDTTQGFSDAISQVVAKKANGLIIDLRNNPGGYLQSAIDIASKMLPANKVVVIEQGSDGKQQKMYTNGGDIASNMETVMLINEGSASASEILSGALKDNRTNVTLIGQKSFGKGSVQQLINLDQGTAAKITVAHWLTPNGDQINKIGITPDQQVDYTNDDFNNGRDPQLDAAMKFLEGKIGK
jgi:carboxyl-terminal processing protease